MSDSVFVESLGSIGTIALVLALIVLPYAALTVHRRSKSRITLHMLVSSSLLAFSTASSIASLAVLHHDFFQARQELGYAIGKSLELLVVYSATWTTVAVFVYLLRARPEA